MHPSYSGFPGHHARSPPVLHPRRSPDLLPTASKSDHLLWALQMTEWEGTPLCPCRPGEASTPSSVTSMVPALPPGLTMTTAPRVPFRQVILSYPWAEIAISPVLSSPDLKAHAHPAHRLAAQFLKRATPLLHTPGISFHDCLLWGGGGGHLDLWKGLGGRARG